MADHIIYEIDLPPIQPETVSSEVYSIHLPISKELAEALDIDERISIEASGIVKELSAGFTDHINDYSLRLDIKRVTVEREGVFEELSRDDDD